MATFGFFYSKQTAAVLFVKPTRAEFLLRLILKLGDKKC